MTSATRQSIFRAQAIYMGFFAVTALVVMDIPGSLFGTGPSAVLLVDAPHSAIGFVEAHGLAAILSLILWRVEPSRYWHLIGAAAALLLGICNLVFWQIFVAVDSLAMGYVTTALHLAIGTTHLVAASVASRVAIAS